MQRIFYLITELEIGGAEKSLVELVTHLNRGRHEAMVACLVGEGPLAARLANAGVRVLPIHMSGWWDVAAWLRLRKALKDFRPHILHSFLFHANLAARVASIGMPMRRICSIRVEEPRRTHLWIERLLQRRADVITCVSQSTRKYMAERAGISESRMAVIPNGIDVSLCDVEILAAPDEWAIAPEDQVVAFAGRLDVQKNPAMLLAAAAQVLKSVPTALFAFAGAGPLENSLQAEARRLGIENRVRWLGWLDDIRPLLARASVLALTSTWEGMPNAVLEAMACRRPVVATAVGGCMELIVDGATGFLVPHGRGNDLADRIVRLLKDKTLCERMGHASRRRAEGQFSVARMVEANEDLYKSLS